MNLRLCLKEQPSFVNPEMKLKSYQLIGISWLNLLFSMNLGAILADEMGLGKTAQVICFIGLLKDRGIKGPHLIIVRHPLSVLKSVLSLGTYHLLENWMREIEKWCPELSAVSYYGSQAERAELREYIPDDVPDIVVTTYNVASGQKDDRSFLRKMRFKTMILDEGHMVKNRLSARYKNLDTLKVQFRVLLTGTPLQNNLLELLSLLTFILPGMFEEDQDFLFKVFNTKGLGTDSAANLLSQKRISRARKMMTPFVLRRKKSNVLKELPKKIQNLELCTATESQEALYKELMADCKKAYADPNMVIEDEPEEPEVNDDEKTKKDVKAGSKKNVSNIIMHLRKAANHPLLFRKHFTDKKIRAMAKDVLKFVESSYDYVLEDMEYMSDFELHKLATKYKRLHKYELPESAIMDSGKVQKLQMLLPELIGKDCRILLFSQFVIMLDVLESVLNNLGIQFARLDGQTPTADRQVIIDGFNLNPSISVFLLSTKACGLGLNLTSANVVILHDIDFNPHNDAQAEDRAHRVGQTRDVHVYKLILDNTIERHMMNLASVKLNLDKQIHEVDPDGKGEKGSEEDVVPSKETSASVLSMLRQEWLEAEKKD
ncbi:SNF2 family N-terminal domain-containing protein [Chytridium lagenaria]|nr:SNF2 family N-terminal domain-containing protein [Chytridium lagenaria]